MKGFIVLLTAFVTSTVQAYQVTPMYQLLDMAGRNSQASYQLTNEAKSDVFVEVKAYKVTFDEKSNEEILVPAEDEFLVLPPQARVASNKTQRFRIRYLGEDALKSTQIYRVVFEQLQTQDNEFTNSNVEFLFNFSTIAFISPLDCQQEAVNAKINNKTLTLSNDGNCVVDLSRVSFSLYENKKSKVVRWQEIKNDTMSNYLIPSISKEVQLSFEGNKFDDVKVNYR